MNKRRRRRKGGQRTTLAERPLLTLLAVVMIIPHTQLFRCWQRKGVFLFFTTLGRVQLAKMFENSLFFPQLDDKSRRTYNGFFFLGGRGVTDTHLCISLSSFGRCTLFLPVKSLIAATAADRKSLTNFLLLASPQSTYTNSKFVIIMILTSSIIFFKHFIIRKI